MSRLTDLGDNRYILKVSAGRGPKGEPGPPGGLSVFTHVQVEASRVWVIEHGLGYRPWVEVVDIEGDICYGDRDDTDIHRTVLSFCLPISGVAFYS